MPIVVDDMNEVVPSMEEGEGFDVEVRKMQFDAFAWGNLDGLGGVVVVGITSRISR